MSSTSASKMTQLRQRGQPRKEYVAPLPDVILPGDVQGELEEPRDVVAEVEARTMRGKRVNGQSSASSRARANELHREADQLFYKGDYESALVLYHRAARLCPRELSHAVAARRAEVVISSTANPSRELGRLLRKAQGRPEQMSAIVSPEVAAQRARDIVNEAPDPILEIPRILQFFDARKDFWRLSSPSTSPRRTRSKLMLRQLSKCVKSTMKDLESAYESGDAQAVHKLSGELVTLVSLTEDPHHNQVNTCGYLVMKQMELGRHDRAVDLAAKMIFLARTSNDVVSFVKALVTVGKVHLKFGHIDALVQVWERLVADLETEAIPQAWLYHDIGRCHLELGNVTRALDSARLCLECAEHARSKKWTLRGQLLSGQCLLKLDRYAEAVAALKIAARIAEEEEEEEQSILFYIQSLIDQVTCLLRRLNSERERRVLESRSNQNLPTESSRLLSSSITKINPSNSNRLGESINVKENLEEKQQQQPRTYLESTSNDGDKIALLLEKTRVLRSPMSIARVDKSAKVSSATAIPALSTSSTDNEVDFLPDTSKTHIIRRDREEADSDEERTLRPDELLPLSDLSCLEDAGESDFASARPEDEDTSDFDKASSRVNLADASTSAQIAIIAKEVNNDKRQVSYFSPDDEMTSRSFTSSLDSETEPMDAPAKSPELAKRTSSLSFYLQSLESDGFDEFLKQESFFMEASVDGRPF